MKGSIDTSFITNQRDMFASGLAADIGMNAYGVWSAIKTHASYTTGKAWPGVRRLAEMTNLSVLTVRRSLQVLEEWKLLRITSKRGKVNVYVARERIDVRLGNRLICTIVTDYIPAQMRENLERIQKALGGADDPKAFAKVDIIPGPGFVWNAVEGMLEAQIPAEDIPADVMPGPDSELALKLLGIQERAAAKRLVDKSRQGVVKDCSTVLPSDTDCDTR